MTIYYHGTPYDFDTFEPVHIGIGTDQNGSGIYLSSSFDDAAKYALKEQNPVRSHVKVFDTSSLKIIDDNHRVLNKKEVEHLIKNCPDHDDALTNFGDVSYEGYQKVFNRAVQGYLNQVRLIDQLNLLNNDFWRDNSANFIAEVSGLLKADGIRIEAVRDEGIFHIVIWNLKCLHCIEEIPVEREILRHSM